MSCTYQDSNRKPFFIWLIWEKLKNILNIPKSFAWPLTYPYITVRLWNCSTKLLYLWGWKIESYLLEEILHLVVNSCSWLWLLLSFFLCLLGNQFLWPSVSFINVLIFKKAAAVHTAQNLTTGRCKVGHTPWRYRELALLWDCLQQVTMAAGERTLKSGGKLKKSLHSFSSN